MAFYGAADFATKALPALREAVALDGANDQAQFWLGVTLLLTGAQQQRELPLAEARRVISAQGEQYGTLADDHPTAVRVRSIFGKLARVAGRRPGLAPEVHVLDTPKIVGESLRGGLVVVSRGLVDLAGPDDALAFVLAHELAHLVRDHHGLLDSLGVLGASITPGRATVPPEQVVRAYRAVELDADRLGVLFAALAGYRVGPAIPVPQTIVERSGPDLFHAHQKERAAAIRDQIGEVADHLEVFHLGLFLLVTGRYLDAAQLLEHFLSIFPSREVMSAAGVAYHKDALRYAPVPEFRHLLAVDAATRAPATRGPAHPLFRQRLERAIHYYSLAVDADPTYAPALNNLAAAYLDLGECELALGHVNRALRADPGLAPAYNNRALAAILAREYTRAEEDLLTAARLAPGLREVAANLARLYEVTGRGDEARRWAQARPAEPAARSDAPDVVGAITPGMPMTRPGEWLSEPGVRQIKLPLGRRAARELTLFVFSRRGIAVVARDSAVEFVAILPHAQALAVRGVKTGDSVARIEAAYGRPPGLEGIQALNVWGFPARLLAFFVVNDRVQAIWAGRPLQGARP